MRVYNVGDLKIVEAAGAMPPPRLLKGLCVLAAHLHPFFDEEPWMLPDFTKQSCVLASLAARDFLRKIGCRAEVASVYLTIVVRNLDGSTGHSLGVGDHKALGLAGGSWDETLKWSGHLVVSCDGWLFDPTLYQCQRPAWPKLPGMIALQTASDEMWLAGLQLEGPPLTRGIEVIWRDQSANKGWRVGADCAKSRRVKTVAKLVDAFESFQLEEA